MVNHFRTLLLNKPASSIEVMFGEYIDEDFTSVAMTAPEKLTRGVILGGLNERSAQEFAATMQFRMMFDFIPVRKVMESIDDRLTFDPYSSHLSEIGSQNIPAIPAVDVIWVALERSHSLPPLFAASGKHSSTIQEFGRMVGSARRKDVQIALVSMILCLRLDEKLRSEE